MRTRRPFPIALLALASLAAAQGVREVPGDHPTIQAAIAVAQAGDVVLVAPGIYNEQLDFLGKAISVVGTGGADQTTIDRGGLVGWFDAPFDPVVRFVNGETAGSVLQGFTITGHQVSTAALSAPIWSEGTPTVVGCRIEGNSGGFAGGFYGSGTLSGCVIRSNTSGREGGGVHGDAQLYDCLIENNGTNSSDGGGFFALPGARAVRCRFFGNVASIDGHSGGGVAGPAILQGCVFAFNQANEFAGQNQAGASAIDGALLVDGCTISRNVFTGVGGHTVRNVAGLVNSIVWDNEEGFGELLATSATYSCVEGGAAGVGNIALDPQFLDALNGDFHLERSSPCVDAGDPGSTSDDDGTARDMGAFFVAQHTASWTPRFGTRFDFDYAPQSNPVIGALFLATVNADPAHVVTAILIYDQPSSPIPTPFGELLVDPNSTLLFVDVEVPLGGVSSHQVPIPNDTGLIGRQVATQAMQLDGALTPTLTNAIDLLVGL